MPFLKVLAIACLLGGACLYLAVLEKSSLSCDRDAGTCTLRQAGVFKTTVTSFSVSDLTGAEIEDSTGNRRAKPAQRIVFLTKQGRVAFTHSFLGLAKRGMLDQAAAVAHFVATPSEARLELRQHNYLAALGLLAVPLLFAAAFWGMAVLAGKLAPRAAPTAKGD